MHGSDARVVVADDNVWVASSLRVLLELWGFRVTVAHDGSAALVAIREVRPAIAIVDLRLPKLDGLEVARQVRADPDLAPLLLLAVTASTEACDRASTSAAGFDVHLGKPVDIDQLRALLLGPRPSPTATRDPRDT